MLAQSVERRSRAAFIARIMKRAIVGRDLTAAQNVEEHLQERMIASDTRRFTSGNRSSCLTPTRVIRSFRLARAVPASTKQMARVEPRSWTSEAYILAETR